MQKYYRLFFIGCLFFALFFSCCTYAAAPVVISQIQPGYSGSSGEEYVEIYNNTAEDVDITNWCLNYSSYTSLEVGTKMNCFETGDINTYLFLPAHSVALAVSNELHDVGLFGSDLVFLLALSDSSGHIRLLDGDRNEVDKIGWGDAKNPESFSIKRTTISNVFQRKSLNPNTLKDTDDNFEDFIEQEKRLTYESGNIYEVVDACPNITGIQEALPAGYIVSSQSNCVVDEPDICPNVAGLQTSILSGMYINELGDCSYVDVCLNLPGNQTVLPDGYELSGDNCILNILPIEISEVLPNPVGSDIGNEFIEFYNPNNVEVGLLSYIFYIGIGDTTEYTFPSGAKIQANGYYVLYNDEIKFTLLNTSSSVGLRAIDNSFYDEASVYASPSEGFSWSKINLTWQYTNNITPKDLNLAMDIIENIEANPSILQPCGPNQYRSTETNRCRSITIATSNLTPCKSGQYRSEETNRCRNIASDISASLPCNEGEERNPDTGRCRKVSVVLGTSTLKPCAVGEERNPETNRCRKVVSSVPSADYKPEVVGQKSDNKVLWFSLAGVGTVAIGYAIWEWRKEIIKLSNKFRSFIHSRK